MLNDEMPRLPQLERVIIVVDHEYDRDAFARALAREAVGGQAADDAVTGSSS